MSHFDHKHSCIRFISLLEGRWVTNLLNNSVGVQFLSNHQVFLLFELAVRGQLLV